jgi:hypothetical protein
MLDVFTPWERRRPAGSFSPCSSNSQTPLSAVALGRVAQMERSAGVPTRSSPDCQRSVRIPRVLGLLNVLRLRQPRSAVSKMIWTTRPAATVEAFYARPPRGAKRFTRPSPISETPDARP